MCLLFSLDLDNTIVSNAAHNDLSPILVRVVTIGPSSAGRTSVDGNNIGLGGHGEHDRLINSHTIIVSDAVLNGGERPEQSEYPQWTCSE